MFSKDTNILIYQLDSLLYFKYQMRKNLGMKIASSKKQLGDYKVDSAFHPDEVV